MYVLLLKYWSNKLKITDDKNIFILFLFIFSAIVFISIFFIELLCINKKDITSLIILLTLIMQYNKNIIVSAIMDIRKSTFLIKKKTMFRFVFFQIMKENFMVIPTAILTFFMAIAAFFVNPIMAVWIILLLIAELAAYFIDSWIALNRRNNKRVQYKRLNFASKTISSYSTISYLVRLPLEEYAEMLIELVILIFCTYNGISVIIINYFLIIFMVLEIEILEDKSMNKYDVTYGKYAFKRIAEVSRMSTFFLSDEFKVLLKYLILEICLFTYGNISVLGFLLLLYTISYRYFCCMQIVLRRRALLKNTGFRLGMMYYILFSIAPFLFEKEMHKIIDGYKMEYGVIYFVIVSFIMLCIPFEKIVKVIGKSVDEK